MSQQKVVHLRQQSCPKSLILKINIILNVIKFNPLGEGKGRYQVILGITWKDRREWGRTTIEEDNNIWKDIYLRGEG